jgi:hypothetical protein
MSGGGATGSYLGGKGGGTAPAGPTPGFGPVDPAASTAAQPVQQAPLPYQNTATPGAAVGGPASGQGVYDQSAGALTSGLNTTYGALSQYGGMAPGSQFDPSMANNPNQIAGGINTYMNPYTDNAINRTMGDIDEQRQIALSQNQGDAARSGAFGGSRHGIVDAETNRYAMDTMGDVSSRMRNDAFGQAAALSAQDVGNNMQTGFANQNAANQGGMFNANQQSQGYNDAFGRNMQGADMLGRFGEQAFNTGQDISQQQAQQGLMQQALNQSVLDQGSAMYQGYANTPQQLLNLRLESLGQNPLNEATTSTMTKTPGMFDYLQMGAGVAGAAMM